ncbi:hypothetical protein GQF61_01620 [Sphingobacterium sp. DK4209]|uniref:Outer membrane beta-barrel protein n=1 Tax=Sphingobacterium zhuxiongii TaxID=2662364 RepID=A0A5Q0Q9B8_9SPHI|nr:MULTISPECIES: hypothetical protein [unclassified Sphingobacterium]MVZ64534.1 hypothetical protein [Sphingobacterium sp. DK4209]QGA25864.1 hypothetical protein GFH32_05830 [Sphingobacterium sp. dk4302]
MKKTLLSLAAAAALAFGANEAQAQTPYKTAIGLGIDLGDGPSLFGPQIKHSFGGANAGQAQVLFGDHFTVVGVDYSYNRPFAGTNGLGWYVGVGPQIAFANDDSAFAIRPAAGLEFKIPSAPLAMHFDWKPWWNLSDESNFEAGRFSLGFKFTLR